MAIVPKRERKRKDSSKAIRANGWKWRVVSWVNPP